MLPLPNGLKIIVTTLAALKDGEAVLYLSTNDYKTYEENNKPKICTYGKCNEVVYNCNVCINHYGILLENEG